MYRNDNRPVIADWDTVSSDNQEKKQGENVIKKGVKINGYNNEKKKCPFFGTTHFSLGILCGKSPT